MKKLATYISIATALASCAATDATISETHAPDGRKAYALNCSGRLKGWDKCQEAAGNICGQAGYEILDRSSEDTMAIAASSSFLGGAKSAERSMLIACKSKKN